MIIALKHDVSISQVALCAIILIMNNLQLHDGTTIEKGVLFTA